MERDLRARFQNACTPPHTEACPEVTLHLTPAEVQDFAALAKAQPAMLRIAMQAGRPPQGGSKRPQSKG